MKNVRLKSSTMTKFAALCGKKGIGDQNSGGPACTGCTGEACFDWGSEGNMHCLTIRWKEMEFIVVVTIEN